MIEYKRDRPIIEYEIKKMKEDGSYILFSVVQTEFGGDAKNWIFNGTYAECLNVLNKLSHNNTEEL